jgi:hypothetical protein
MSPIASPPSAPDVHSHDALIASQGLASAVIQRKNEDLRESAVCSYVLRLMFEMLSSAITGAMSLISGIGAVEVDEEFASNPSIWCRTQSCKPVARLIRICLLGLFDIRKEVNLNLDI